MNKKKNLKKNPNVICHRNRKNNHKIHTGAQKTNNPEKMSYPGDIIIGIILQRHSNKNS
jgi:hypothetical protein